MNYKFTIIFKSRFFDELVPKCINNKKFDSLEVHGEQVGGLSQVHVALPRPTFYRSM
jgi:hypothetical protein